MRISTNLIGGLAKMESAEQTKKQIRIGVLGGIGPEATGLFYNQLIGKMQDLNLIKSNSDFPQIIVNSIPAPELIYDNLNDADLDLYKKGIVELDSLKPDFIIMVCNTIHLFHQELQSLVETEIIDLRKIVHNYLLESGTSIVTVIGTPSTIKLGLYEYENVNYINPSKEEFRELTDAIFRFNKGENKKLQKARVQGIAKSCISKGSDLILLACTEFGVMLESSDMPRVNTMDILVDFVIARYREN